MSTACAYGSVRPMSEASLGENKYFFLLVDDFSRWSWVYFLKNKSEALQQFKNFHILIKRQTGRKLKVARSYIGGEFMLLEF